MPAAVIVDAVRTPIGLRNGQLSGWHPTDLASAVLEALASRNDLDPGAVDDVILGCVMQVGSQGLNIARNAVLAAGWPDTVAGTTVDRQGASSQQAVHFAAQGVLAGAYDIVVAGGVEVMSTTPMGASVVPGAQPFGPSVVERYRPTGGLVPEGVAADRLAEHWGLTRDDLDAFAARSHARAERATTEGRFIAEVVPITGRLLDRNRGEVVVGREPVRRDEGIRAGITIEDLAALRPSFDDDGVVTAGNAAQIGDGAAAVLVMSEERAAALGCTPLARVHAMAVVGSDPVLAHTGLVPATAAVLQRAGLDLDAVHLVEVNEAFASVVLAWAQEVSPDLDRVNVNGGAIALGQPVGCSGARLLTTLVHELSRSGGRYGLQVMAGAGGLGTATVIERL